MGNTGDHRPTPTSIDLLGIEPLEEHARRLAALFTVSPDRRGSAAHLKRLRHHARALRHVYTSLSADAARGEPSSPAAEWLLDNFHIVLAALRGIHGRRRFTPHSSFGSSSAPANTRPPPLSGSSSMPP